MFTRVIFVVLILVTAGCSRTPGSSSGAVGTTSLAATFVGKTSPGMEGAGVSNHADGSHVQGFASLADHGDLFAYPGKVVRHEGAYTWYRADVSEAHALRAVAGGTLRMTTPDGHILDFKYDRHIEHASGDWTWVGHLAGHKAEQAILTFGDQATFGLIDQPGKPALRLTVRDGTSWLVATDPDMLAVIGSAGTRAQGTDFRIVPPSSLRPGAGPATTGGGSAYTQPAAAPAVASAAASGTEVVDLLIGYSGGFATAMGGASAAMTRLNHLVDVTNAAYESSKIHARLRLIHAMQVNYTDTNSNDVALKELTGYDSDTNKEVPTNPAFNALRAARETYHADMVSLVRDFHTPENGGCGIAWLLGGGLAGVSGVADSEGFAYSVVSDGSDTDESDSKTYYCQDETLAHELGHNMGAAHDRDTSKGDDGTLDNPDDYGAFTYSFGAKTAISAGNFYTIMSYGDSGQHLYRIFSTPGSTSCGGNACGTGDTDNAKTLNQTVATVAGFRKAMPKAYADFNGDGRSDIVWRNLASGDNVLWPSANKALSKGLFSVPKSAWFVAGVGDFDGDGASDMLWRNSQTGDNILWPSADRTMRRNLANVPRSAWNIVGIGDFDGDGKSDILWRNSASGSNVIWPSANRALRRSLVSVPQAAWFVAGVGDFDSDGQSDILWRNPQSGVNILWPSADRTQRQQLATVPMSAWFVAGVGDFDGDGQSDLLWRNPETGQNILWPSANRAKRRQLANAHSVWIVASVGDYGGNGESDILWRNPNSGVNVLWPSANRTIRQQLGGLSPSTWQVVSK